MLGLPRNVRFNALVNSMRTWKFIRSLIRKLRPMLKLSVGWRGPRKSVYSVSGPNAPATGLVRLGSAPDHERVDAVAVEILVVQGLAATRICWLVPSPARLLVVVAAGGVGSWPLPYEPEKSACQSLATKLRMCDLLSRIATWGSCREC